MWEKLEERSHRYCVEDSDYQAENIGALGWAHSHLMADL